MGARLHFFIGLLFLLTAPAIPAAAQDAASAKTFLESVYQHYQHGGKGIDLGGPHAGEYFHSSLLTLVRADAKANGPENVGVIDSDPVCGCQDWDGIWDLKIDVNVQTPQRATARVSFAAFQRRTKEGLRDLEITLVPERGQWRIYNILDESDPKAPFDLRKELERDIASLRKAPK
jgi:hypothetical protein